MQHRLVATADSINRQWKEIVELVEECPPELYDITCKALSQSAHIGFDSLKRRVSAVIHARSLGYSCEEIIAAGQEKTMSDYLKSKKQEKYGQTVRMQFEVPGFLRELIQQDFERIKRVLGVATSEDLFDFLHSMFENMTDEEIRQMSEGREV